MTAPLIRFEGVEKRFPDGTRAVDGVDLDIAPNEFFALLGPSGCGKTTLLRMLAGFEAPTAGQVILDGKPLDGVPPNHRPVNMVFQSYAVFPHMTVARNVGYGLEVTGVPKGEIGPRVAEALAMVRLDGYYARKPDQLSGGQRQRVALARALVKRPKVLLLDEPLSALDKKLREEMQLELTRLQEAVGITFVMVTHDQEEALSVATRIGVMNAGRLIQIGAPHDVYENPTSRTVARFLGSVNLFEGRVEDRSGELISVVSPAAGCPIRIESDRPADRGVDVAVALRPEKIEISKTLPEGVETNCATGVVREITYLGTLSTFHVELDTGLVVRALLPNATRQTEMPITWDDRVAVRWRPRSAVLLVD